MEPPSRSNDEQKETKTAKQPRSQELYATETVGKLTTLTHLERVLLLEAEHELSARRLTARNNRRGPKL